MKNKALFAGVFFLLSSFLSLISPSNTAFAAPHKYCSEYGIDISQGAIGGSFNEGDAENSINFTASGLQASSNYKVYVVKGKEGSPTLGLSGASVDVFSSSSGYISANLEGESFFKYESTPYNVFHVMVKGPGIPGNDLGCILGTYMVNYAYKCGDIKVFQENPNQPGTSCYNGAGGCTEGDKDISVQAQLLRSNGEPAVGVRIIINVTGESDQQGNTDAQGFLTKSFPMVSTGEHNVMIELDDNGTNRNLCTGNFTNAISCQPDQCIEDPISIADQHSVIPNVGAAPYILCDQIDKIAFSAQYEACVQCAGGSDENAKAGVWTAIGCIKREPAEIAQTLIRVGLMMGGGVALLMMLVAAFMLSTSQGEPKRTEDAKDMVTAAFMGLLFVIFSVTILQFIGFSILKIPGFGGSV